MLGHKELIPTTIEISLIKRHFHMEFNYNYNSYLHNITYFILDNAFWYYELYR